MMRATSISQNSTSSWALLIKVDFRLLNLSLLLLGGLITMIREIILWRLREAHGTLNILSSHIKYRKIVKERLEHPPNQTSSKPDILQTRHPLNQATVYPVQAIGDGFTTRTFSKGNRTVRLAFEERKTDERIESNSTFRFPSEVSLWLAL